MSKFYWGDLIDSLVRRTRSVVPIVGSELLDSSPEPSGRVAARLAAEAREILRREFDERGVGTSVPDDASLEQLRKLARVEQCDFPRILHEAHAALLAQLDPARWPEPLRLLREMREVFPFIVTTTTDDLLPRALGLTRGDIRATTLSSCVDLEAGWQPGQAPRLFHLFGSIEADSDIAISDEDRLEYLSHLHHRGRPERLLSHLRESHLLFLGQRFPEYLTLVFLRLLRGERFAGEGKAGFDAIADPEVRTGQPLVGFLRTYAARTRIYEAEGTAGFLRELHQRWRDAVAPVAPSEPAAPEPGTPMESEPADMPRPAIFLSYASENRACAEALAAALQSRKLPVWLDRWQLEGGDRYAAKIERHIRRSRLFVPLLSRAAAARQRGWFRREWNLASELLRDVGPELTWVLPVVIDDLSPYDSPDLDEYFTLRGRQPQVMRCRDGQPSEDDLDLFVRKYQEATRAAAPIA